MSDRFSTSPVKPTSSHDRSRFSLQSQWCSCEGPDNPIALTVDQYPSRRPLKSLDEDGLAAPCRTHQRGFTPERRRSTRRELPPLLTQPRDQEHNPDVVSPPASLQNFDSLQFSSPLSRQSSPSKVGGRVAEWFKGESDPIAFRILPSPTKEEPDPLDIMPPLSASRTSPVQKDPHQAMPKPPMSSRFSFFTTKAPLHMTPQQSVDDGDGLSVLDVHKALFPAGPADPFSPAAFKNLVQNAEGLLSRLQTAYKERTQSLREMTVEKETQAEELEGAETRAQHLKIQLDDMAARLAEQDDAMMNLVDDLAREKQLRREEEAARRRSVMLVKASGDAHAERSQRESRSSINSDRSCESEAESSAESVFSHRYGATSPTMSMSSVSTTNSPDVYQPLDLQSVMSVTEATQHTPVFNPLPTAKGMAGSDRRNDTISWQGESQGLKCANCHGLTTNEAWNVVGVLKEENKALKGRVEHMEGALDGCLDVVEMLR